MEENDELCGISGWGKAGAVTIDIYEAVDESQCELSVSLFHENGSAEFRFHFNGVDGVKKLACFFTEHIGKREFHEQAFSLFGQEKLLAVKDDGFADRFFLKMISPSVFFDQTLGGPLVGDFSSALNQALDSFDT